MLTGQPDFECTFWFEGTWHHCCIAHDLGGSDEQLAQCVAQSTGWASWGLLIAALMYFGVKMFRPILRAGKKYLQKCAEK
jgi:hypothetical protein